MKLLLPFLFFLSTSIFAATLDGRKPLKYPVVLVHGASMGGAKLKLGPLHVGDYFNGVLDFYKATNTPVTIMEMPAGSSIGEGAAVLKDFLDTEFPHTKVNLIAHSLGGLNSRYAASILKSNKIASITTIATPHYGSPLALWGVLCGLVTWARTYMAAW